MCLRCIGSEDGAQEPKERVKEKESVSVKNAGREREREGKSNRIRRENWFKL